MSDAKSLFLKDELFKHTSVFGLHLWVLLGICVGAAIIPFLLISLWLTSRRNRKTSPLLAHKIISTIPKVSREIQEIRLDPDPTRSNKANSKLLLPPPPPAVPEEDQRIHIEIGKGHRTAYPGKASGKAPEVSHLGWGHWYTLRELEESTNGFAAENVIGEGGYRILPWSASG